MCALLIRSRLLFTKASWQLIPLSFSFVWEEFPDEKDSFFKLVARYHHHHQKVRHLVLLL